MGTAAARRSLPGGAVEPAVYDALSAEIVERAHERPVRWTACSLDIHGAMSVVGRDDAEGDLATAVRDAVGPDTLDLRLDGPARQRLARLASTVDLITCYRIAPHEDAWESRERAARNLVDRLRSGGRPRKAWVQVPVLLPGEKTSTRIDRPRACTAGSPASRPCPACVDAAIWVGYAWADEPRCRAAVVVTGDDAEAITDGHASSADDVLAGPRPTSRSSPPPARSTNASTRPCCHREPRAAVPDQRLRRQPGRRRRRRRHLRPRPDAGPARDPGRLGPGSVRLAGRPGARAQVADHAPGIPGRRTRRRPDRPRDPAGFRSPEPWRRSPRTPTADDA